MVSISVSFYFEYQSDTYHFALPCIVLSCLFSLIIGEYMLRNLTYELEALYMVCHIYINEMSIFWPYKNMR